MSWAGEDALYFTLDLQIESDGPVIESAHIAMSRHSRVIEYTSPHRYRGDLLIMDGVRLHLEEDEGHESLRPTVFRDLQNRELMWLASHLFGDFWEAFDVTKQPIGSDGRLEFQFAEKEPLAPVELVKIKLDPTQQPITGQLFDHERDEVWKLDFSLKNVIEQDGDRLKLLSDIKLTTSDGSVYFLKLRDMRRGALDHMLRGHAASHE